jgi:hypothetical protein
MNHEGRDVQSFLEVVGFVLLMGWGLDTKEGVGHKRPVL